MILQNLDRTLSAKQRQRNAWGSSSINCYGVTDKVDCYCYLLPNINFNTEGNLNLLVFKIILKMIGYWIDIFILILMVKTKSNPRSLPKLCEGVGINMSSVPQEAQF